MRLYFSSASRSGSPFEGQNTVHYEQEVLVFEGLVFSPHSILIYDAVDPVTSCNLSQRGVNQSLWWSGDVFMMTEGDSWE